MRQPADDGSLGGLEQETTALLDAFEDWQRRRGVADDDAVGVAIDAALALDWKLSAGDGNLVSWRREHVREFLLDWCPRKLGIPAEEARAIPEAFALFAAFLDETGRLAPGSSPVAHLTIAAASLAEEFVAAMDDPSQFGMAKSLFAAAEADGVDLGDPQQFEEWVEAFNAGPADERHRVLGGSVPPPRRPALPPVVQPSDGDVAASRAAAPILRMFADLAAYVGAGRPLTQKGNLTLADARALVDLLGTGDCMDGRIGGRTFKTRSAAELPRLRLVFAWARKAGVLRVAKGKVVATKAGLAIDGDPALWFERAADALLAIGPLRCQRLPDHWFSWPQVDELLDRFTVHLLAAPYAVQRPIPLEDLASVAADGVLQAFVFETLADERVAGRVAVDVTDIVDALALAGVVERIGVEEVPDEVLIGRRFHGGAVSLTPAGVVTTRRLLEAAGYEAPAAGHFADATATELLAGADGSDIATFCAELEAWRRRRAPDEALRQLADAVVALEDPALCALALAAMADLDAQAAAPLVRRLATLPPLRGMTLSWLVENGFEAEDVLFDPDDPGTLVDVLAHRLVTGGPPALAASLALAGDDDRQLALLDRLWRSPSPDTEFVLAALGETHPAKKVAKAARKGLFRRRSWAVP